MIKWIRVEPGEYFSDDKRFMILNSWDRVYGNHWVLYDKEDPDRFKGKYHEKTLLDCKMKAEDIMNDK